MRQMRGRAGLLAFLAVVAAAGLAGSAARVVPNRFDLAQSPGTQETYTLILEGDQATTEELRLYLGDWERYADGEHDWGIPVNGARWSSERAFSAGEVFAIQYKVSNATPEGTVTGTFRSGAPQISGSVDAQLPAASTASQLVVSRSVDGDVVTLRVECRAAFQGLVITETYSRGVQLSALDAAGGSFDTVERSCTGWIELGESVVQLQPGERREIAFRVSTPLAYEGSYWSALFVEAPPLVVEQGGTRVLSIPRTAIKIFVTAPGTERAAGAVTAVSVLTTNPLTLSASFENTGNVELVVAGEAEVVDRSGTVVRVIAVPEVKVLPGATRILSISDAAGASGLPSGVYQASVRLEYGGEYPVVGVRGFRVP